MNYTSKISTEELLLYTRDEHPDPCQFESDYLSFLVISEREFVPKSAFIDFGGSVYCDCLNDEVIEELASRNVYIDEYE